MLNRSTFEFLFDLVFSAIEFVLGCRFLFKILGADNTNSLVNSIYSASEKLQITIIRNLPTFTIKDNMIIETRTIISIIIYAIINILIITLVRLFISRTKTKR